VPHPEQLMQTALPRPPAYFSPTIYQIATAVGLVSVTFFFGALILAFGIRIEQQHTWERFHLPGILWLSTTALLASSWTLEGARRALRRAHVAIYRGRIAATLALALLFLLVQAVSASDLLRQGVGASANPHGSAFYLFMAVHGAHLLGGMGWLHGLYRSSRALFRGSETQLRQHRKVTNAAAMYWHFMGVLWLVLFFFLNRWTAA
jgi:cytochrome c oxidase subunit 3